MNTERVMFFATRKDLNEVIELAATDSKLFGFRAGPHYAKDILIAPEFDGFRDDEICPSDSAQAPQYLIWGSAVGLKYRLSTTRSGSIRYMVGPDTNVEAILLKPGGQNDSRTVISGELSVISKSDSARNLFKLMKTAFRKKFKKINSYYVGAGALSILMSGGRLTSNAKAPKEYDLCLPMAKISRPKN